MNGNCTAHRYRRRNNTPRPQNESSFFYNNRSPSVGCYRRRRAYREIGGGGVSGRDMREFRPVFVCHLSRRVQHGLFYRLGGGIAMFRWLLPSHLALKQSTTLRDKLTWFIYQFDINLWTQNWKKKKLSNTLINTYWRLFVFDLNNNIITVYDIVENK